MKIGEHKLMNKFNYPIENQIASASGRMNRAYRRMQELRGELAIITGEFCKAREEFQQLHQMRAEQEVEVLPPVGEKKRREVKDKADSILDMISSMKMKDVEAALAKLREER